MKKLFFLLPLLALFVACQPDDPITESGYITFTNQQVEDLTRGDNTITTANLANFDVWGHNDAGIVFNGSKVEKQGDMWASAEQKMWAHSTTYHFHAFAPSGLISNVGDYPNSERTKGLSNFTYTNEGDKDLIYAYATRTQGSALEINDEPVQLAFEHLLSRVQFTFNNSLSKGNITISNVQIVEAVKSAELNCADASMTNWAWTGISTGAYNFGSTSEIEKGGNGMASDVQFMFPAATRNYNIAFNLGYESDSAVERVAAIADVNLEMGKSYNITVVIEDKDVVTEQYKINFFVVEVKEWGENINLNATMNENLENPELPEIPEIIKHEYVDLGLSVKWATCNVGANSPEEYGDYFAWGEVEPKGLYNWNTYKLCTAVDNECEKLLKYVTSSNFGVVDNKLVLEAKNDAAAVNWGGNWRMPTKEEQNELIEKCTWVFKSKNGVDGYEVISRIEGYHDKSIFLPAAGYMDGMTNYDLDHGYYWSSSLYDDDDFSSYRLNFSSYTYPEMDYEPRHYGYSVRPVCP